MTLGALVLLILVVGLILGFFPNRIDPTMKHLLVGVIIVICIIALLSVTGLLTAGVWGRPIL